MLSLYLPYVEVSILYAYVCVCLYVLCVYCLSECPPYQVKFLVCVHTWPIKLILSLIESVSIQTLLVKRT